MSFIGFEGKKFVISKERSMFSALLPNDVFAITRSGPLFFKLMDEKGLCGVQIGTGEIIHPPLNKMVYPEEKPKPVVREPSDFSNEPACDICGGADC